MTGAYLYPHAEKHPSVNAFPLTTGQELRETAGIQSDAILVPGF